ncbi:isopenicillin N synthase family dioxygenase [Actinoplanes couchii]|uniref:2OG-Fe(II) oxygenase n=1 Tax=Actinoplanes couchii TaxID=403638 RepID=A0ABQ3XGY2_9ACTN|nr:isopenicillin N synthase family oxygenase [Actinoplanes couchii]MDR6320751.1 isopenicillin N synthase-like dioxygenase [Actinoplanes couchii]GID57763.1 2OG-Fe(II) oxygenase [Actinoplanes couchii]
MVSDFVVPTVDISAWVSGERDEQTVRELDLACRTVGFVQIVGHGVPAEVTDGLADAIDGFFGQSLEAKKRWIRPASENRGYSPPKSESLSYSLGVDPVARMNDYFEAYNIGVGKNTWPDEPTAFRPQVEAHFREARRVAETLTSIFAAALGVEPDFFDRIAGNSIDVLRMNNYALEPGEIEPGADLTGMGEHTDFGIVTVLWADQVAGLQVLGTDNVWHDVQPADGALLVNLGDISARLTNDVWMSTLHRVKPPIVGGTIERRRSAAFFHDGNGDALIETLPRFVPEGGVPLYEPITVAEHIAAKLAGSREGHKNTGAVRDAARVLAASPGVTR